MAEQSVEIVEGAYAAFARGDVPGVLAAMADDIEWHEAEGMPDGGVHRGGDAVVRNVFGPITTDIDDFAVTPIELIPSGDTVAVAARYTGTGKSTGKELDLEVVHVGTCVTARSFVSGSSPNGEVPGGRAGRGGNHR